MERKTLKITLFSNESRKCLVDGETYDIGKAKVYFGDWDKLEDYHELQRRKFRGCGHFDFEVETKEVKGAISNDTPLFEDQAVEPEFPDLSDKKEEITEEKESKPEEIQLDPEKCSAITKSGKQCKMDKAEGCEECSLHLSKKK